MRGRSGSLIVLIALAVLPRGGLAQTSAGNVEFLIGYDALADEDAVLEGGGLGLDVAAGWFVGSRWQLGGSLGLKLGPEGCVQAVGSGASGGGGCGSDTDLYALLGRVRFWPVPLQRDAAFGVFLATRLGVAHRVKDGGSAYGFPVGADLGALVPITDRIHVHVSGFIERIFFEQEFDDFGDPDQTATRAGFRIGLGSLFGIR